MVDSLRLLVHMPARFCEVALPGRVTRTGTAGLLALAAVALAPAALAAHHPAPARAHTAAHPHSSAAARPHAAHTAPATHQAAVHGGTQKHRQAMAVPVAANGKGRTHVGRRELAQATSGPLRSSALHFGNHYTPLSVASTMSTRRSQHVQQAPQGKHGQSLAEAAERRTNDSVPAAAPEQRADRSVQDRVHAWYAKQDTGVAALVNTTPTDAPVAEAAKSSLLGSATPVAALPKAPVIATQTRLPALHTVSQPTIAAIPQTPPADTRTTADDDAAFAEASHIPSTAPTERVPLPFVHGDFAAPTTPHVAAGPTPRSVRIDPRGDAEVLAAASPRNGVKNAPGTQSTVAAPGAGTAALTAAAKKPRPDPALAGGMAAEALDDDEALETAQGARGTQSDAQGRKPVGYDLALHGTTASNVNLYDGAGQLILLPPMKGSHEILVHQNQMAISDGLDRIGNDAQLSEMHRLKLLVALPDTDAIYPNGRLPLNRRYARPWTVRFLNDLGAAHWQRFHTPLIVTSAVRTVAFQRHLVLVNGNAAPPTGDVASPHLYGQAVDIAKHSMSVTELAWMRSYLTPVEGSGKIDVEEEFQQACFHISVYRRYAGLPELNRLPDPAPQRTLQLARAPQPAPAVRPMQRVRAVLKRHRRLPTALLAAGLR